MDGDGNGAGDVKVTRIGQDLLETYVNEDGLGRLNNRLQMDGAGDVEVTRIGENLGQETFGVVNYDDLGRLLNNNVVKEEILQYLDGSALINLIDVNKQIRQLVTSSKRFKKCINLRMTTKNMELLTIDESLPQWTENLTNLTLVYNSDSPEYFFDTTEKLSSFQLARTLLHLSTLEIINESKDIYNASKFALRILKLSSKLKSLSLSYELLLNPNLIDFEVINLRELKFTSSQNYEVQCDEHFMKNLKFFTSNCFNLKSFTCQELGQVQGRYDNIVYYENYKLFAEILRIIENNSGSLEKLEMGISQLVSQLPTFSTKFAQISFPNLKYFDLRAVNPNYSIQEESPVIEILKKLPQPGQLTTLKLAMTVFPLELFDLIPEKFPQLISLSLKASKYSDLLYNGKVYEDSSWCFLQTMTQLEELEITKFIIDRNISNFGLGEISNLQIFLPNKNLRKLALRGLKDGVGDYKSFINGIWRMADLKELALTGSPLDLSDFMSICTNFKLLEKLEISHLKAENPDSQNSWYSTDTDDWVIEYDEISTLFSNLKYLKEMSIEIWSGDFSPVLESMNFPYLRSLTLANVMNLEKDDPLLNIIIALNPMLKEFSIVNFTDGYYTAQGIEIDGRKNLKIENSFRQIKPLPHEIRDDFDPDSKP